MTWKGDRRDFLKVFPFGAAAAALLARPTALRANVVHPDPRPDIDGSQVMTREELSGWSEDIIELYEGIAEIPGIADGIGCACGCSLMPNYRSLLTCFYADGMARGCHICQGEARLVIRRHAEGQALERIRRAIDARFG